MAEGLKYMLLYNYRTGNDDIKLKHLIITLLFLILFFGYIISLSAFIGFLCDKYPQIDRFVDTHPFLVILIRIVFLIVIPALFAIFILDFKDRKKSRCPKCKTKYKYGDMEIEPSKIITTFQCKKCGYINKVTEPFVFNKFKRIFDKGNISSEELKELEELSKLYDKNLDKRD